MPTWIRPPSNRSAKFKHNIVKGIFLGFVSHTKGNILWYNYDTGHIGPANYVTFNEGMNDLHFSNLPPNQRNLERAELGNKFPAEPEKVDVANELQFYLYSFSKMETKALKVLPRCNSSNFGLTIERDL